MKLFKTIFFLLVGSLSLLAQDATYFQFQNAGLQNNPSLVGEHADGRLIANYQLGSAAVLQRRHFDLASISYDRAIQLKNGDQIGLGIRTEGLFAIDAFLERSLFGGVSIAYRKYFDEAKHILAAGLEGGSGQRFYSYISSWSSGPSMPVEDIVNIFDLNAGLSYTGHFDKIKELQLGVAYHHLNRADIAPEKFREDRLYRRFTAHGSLLFAPTKLSLLRPQVFARLQGPSVVMGAGAIATQKLKENYSDFALNIGGYVYTNNRLEDKVNFDNLTLLIGPEFKGFSLNYSRNFDLSDLRYATRYFTRNELSFIWKL